MRDNNDKRDLRSEHTGLRDTRRLRGYIPYRLLHWIEFEVHTDQHDETGHGAEFQECDARTQLSIQRFSTDTPMGIAYRYKFRLPILH